jgi:hypothetical protein
MLFVWSTVVLLDVKGIGTWWRRVGMRYYDRQGGLETYERNTRRFLLTYRLVAVLGFFLLVGGLLN